MKSGFRWAKGVMTSTRSLGSFLAVVSITAQADAQVVGNRSMSDEAIRSFARTAVALRYCGGRFFTTRQGAALIEAAYRRKPDVYLAAQNQLLTASLNSDRAINRSQMCALAAAAFDSRFLRQR
jgi:hypothetical protein